MMLALAISYLLVTLPAEAQSQPALNLTVTPATIDMISLPGSTVEQKIRVRNNSANPIDLSIATSKLTTDSKGTVIPEDSKDAYLSWISYTPSSFTALPNEWTDIAIHIKIPTDAAFGYYYAIRVTPTKNPNTHTSGSTLIGQAVVPLLLSVKKDGAIANIQLVSFSPTQSLFEYLPATFAITFVNKGNVHIRPLGNIFITSGGSKDVAVLEFNASQGAMLPGQKRSYSSSWDDGFLIKEPVIQDSTVIKDAHGNPKTHLVIHWDKLTSFRIGKYTAHLLAVYNDGTRDIPLEATTTFWILPWKMVLSGLGGVIAIIILIKLWLGWYVRRQIKKHNNS